MQNHNLDRREFLGATALGAAALAVSGPGSAQKDEPLSKPNLIYVFADQWRYQAAGYAGDPNVATPNLDSLEKKSLNFEYAVSGCPVCSPYRASLLTGQYWLTNGHFLNDLSLDPGVTSIADVLKDAGYDTAYIGKWHLDGHGRSNFIPRERRQGFDYWKVLECTHNYNESYYFADSDERLKWEDYDAIAQTRDAENYIRGRKESDSPFALFLSWGPPHAPYETAPERYRKLYDPQDLTLAPNVPPGHEVQAREDLAGYYAHIAALDECLGELMKTIEEAGIEDNTIFVFTSDHGDMLHSQGSKKKQQPWDESLRVPFLLRYPEKLGREGRRLDALINTPDLMPTLLGLCGVGFPDTVEGRDYSKELLAGKDPVCEAALYLCAAPFGQWTRELGGRECRGVRTHRYTYVRDLEGPWLLYDNAEDPYQIFNIVKKAEHSKVARELDERLNTFLAQTNDDFVSAEELIARWGYTVNEELTVPYTG
jgi:arylsulfatase A-like enzyme